eukprot:261334-Chlamydomonas_euryale.AAC.2
MEHDEAALALRGRCDADGLEARDPGHGLRCPPHTGCAGRKAASPTAQRSAVDDVRPRDQQLDADAALTWIRAGATSPMAKVGLEVKGGMI